MSRRALLMAPLLVLALAGCVPVPSTVEPGASGSPSPTAAPTATPTPTPTPTVTAQPAPQTEPVGLGCGDIISAQAIYDYNPNVSLLDTFTPDGGSLAAEAVAKQGVACRLINQTSGETIDIGVVRFTKAGFAAKEASFSGSSSDAFDGYFDGGSAQAFASPFWVTVSSSTFQDGSDAAPLVTPILGSLG